MWEIQTPQTLAQRSLVWLDLFSNHGAGLQRLCLSVRHGFAPRGCDGYFEFWKSHVLSLRPVILKILTSLEAGQPRC